MIYCSTIDNLRYLFRSIGYISEKQAIKLFRDAEDCEQVPFYLSRLCVTKDISLVDNVNRIFMARKTRAQKPEFVASLVRAFWIIAALKSEELIDVFPEQYPSQYGFITAKNMSYDITICDTKMHAQIAMKKRFENLPKDATDTTHHIALVRDEELGKVLLPYGFDSFCILDADNTPQYYNWS